ncbi:hypothetical protein [Aeromonas veronii]|uniref:hypothetical protein n=1 Tax=Aeromonas veronii TaxID=654 RepID=UPI0018F206B1|nr:hypothetical protein [Aeromonas veronii]MBJ7591982.1 hypothetical protein [Aeromonas veronii]
MSTTYSAIVELETNANQLLTRLSAASNAGESVKHARACLTEAIEHLVYAAREEIAKEGVCYECSECGKTFPLHFGSLGCPNEHEVPATLFTRK